MMDTTTFDLIYLFVAGLITSLACGLGAIPVFFLGSRVGPWQPTLRGLAAGLMSVAAVEGMIRPALVNSGIAEAAIGTAVGVVFLLALRRIMRDRDMHVGALRGAGVRRSALVFGVLFVHSLPEGMAMGAAHASSVEGLGLFVLAAIALQNIPEGTAVAIPMQSAGFGRSAQFWAAVITSVPQPLAAPLAYLLVHEIKPMLPISLAFAGGAMLAVVAVELVPEAFGSKDWQRGCVGALAGAALMIALSLALGV
jgi:ZIP family zinc transporter